jgi:predicted metalloprotease with PDZ domain
MFHYSTKRVYLGKGLNGAILGNWGRVPQLSLGPWTWAQVPAAFTFAQSTQQKINYADLHGSLGGEFLRRFIVTFHYLDQYVVLKPIARQWKRQFDLGMSGLSFRTQGSTYQQFIVETIQANSPAEEAGIQVGDELWFINGMRASEYRLGDIYRMLRKKEGKKMELIIKRDQNFHMISFTLRALF